jgi:hypothetical protein
MKTRLHSIIRCILLPVLLSAMAACQGATTPGEPGSQTVNPTVVSETGVRVETPALPATGAGPSGLTGQVIAESDVSGQADEPLPGQMVLAVPVEKAGETLGAGGRDPTDEELRFLKAILPQADPALAVTTTDAAGDYTLLLDPGVYILCVADSEITPPGFPATTRGCGRTQVTPGGLRRVDISSGFGEILLVER